MYRTKRNCGIQKIQTHIWDDHISEYICKSNVAFLDYVYIAARPGTVFETNMPFDIGLLEAKHRPKC